MLFSDSVMCVREERNAAAPPMLFSRGQKRPLFSGAASKVILAHLPPHQLRSLYAKHRRTIALSGLGADWDIFRTTLRQIREHGYCVTVGEFSSGIVGIAAPVFNRAGKVLGSLGLAMAKSAVQRSQYATLARAVTKAAQDVTQRVSSAEHGVDLPARAVG